MPDIFSSARRSDAVILYGGSFNPLHIGHYLFVSALCAYFPSAEKWIVPTYRHAFDKVLMDYDRRVNVLHRAFDGMPRVIVSTIERDLHAPASYTVDIVRALRSAMPGRRIFVVIGADIVPELDRWHEIEILRSISTFLIFPRQGCDSSMALPIPPLPEVSSTEIRAAVERNDREFVRARVPAFVFDDLFA